MFIVEDFDRGQIMDSRGCDDEGKSGGEKGKKRSTGGRRGGSGSKKL